MNPTPYLTFKGQCRDAMTTYAEIFGGEIAMMMTASDMPGFDAPEEMADWIMHSVLALEGGILMASDDMMGTNPAMAGSWVMMEMPSVEAGAKAFEALGTGGDITMPWAPTQWSEGFGMVTDRFGTRWMLSGPNTMP